VPDDRVDGLIECAPLVVVTLIGTLRKGAFFTPDIVVLPCMCLALALVSPTVLRWLRAHPAASVVGAAGTAWWLIDAVIWNHGVDSWRMASTWVCAGAGYAIARGYTGLRSGAAVRRMAAAAFTAIGVALSIAGLAAIAARSHFWTWADERSLRFQGPLTYPSAIGLYLLLTLLVSTEFWPARDDRGDHTSRVLTACRAIVFLGVAATDSRGALVALVAMLCFRTVRRALAPAVIAAAVAAPLVLYGQRDGVRPWLIAASLVVAIVISFVPEGLIHKAIAALALPAVGVAGWLFATQHHAVSGFDASWTERGHILRSAVTLFTHHPIVGAGPDPRIPTTTLTGLRGIDAFAHNEPLEILISVGILGAAALILVVAVAVRPLWRNRGALAAPVLVTLALAGLFDFVLHFPVVGLLAGSVAGLSTSRDAGSSGHISAPRRELGSVTP
jgi:hypothetical protein